MSLWFMTSIGITLRTQMKIFNKLHYVLDDAKRDNGNNRNVAAFSCPLQFKCTIIFYCLLSALNYLLAICFHILPNLTLNEPTLKTTLNS